MISRCPKGFFSSIVLIANCLLISIDALAFEPSTGGIMHVGDRQYIGGDFAISSPAGTIAWKSQYFDQPFEFPLDRISEVTFRQGGGAETDQGEFGFELTNGDLLFGSMSSLAEGKITIETEVFGGLTFDAGLVRRIFRWSGGSAQIFSGPGTLDDWPNERQAKVNADGRFVVGKPYTSYFRDVGLTGQCRIEIDVSWEKTPNFVMAFGTDGTAATSRQAPRIEFWGSAIVMLRELDEIAKVSSLGSTDDAEGRLRLAIELDQRKQLAIVYSERGVKLGEIRFDGRATEGVAHPGIQIVNFDGSFRLNDLKILQGAGSQVDNGFQIASELVSLEDGVLTIRTTDGEQTTTLEMLNMIRIEREDLGQTESKQETSGQAEVEKADATAALNTLFHLQTRGSTKLTGRIESLSDQKLVLKTNYLESVLEIEQEQIQSLRSSRKFVDYGTSTSRRGTLEMDDTRLVGVLVDSATTELATCLKFQPLQSLTAANLLPTAGGRINYREKEKIATSDKPVANQNVRRRRPAGFMGAVVGAFVGNNVQDVGISKRHLHLRSGDAVDAEVLRISEEGVLINSVVTGERWIPNDKVKAVDLRTTTQTLSLDSEKRTRLLLVPRMRKNTPPTHLLISVDGDYLKGNLISMDDETIVIENRLESMEIPRRVVAQIIWFHADEIDGDTDKNTEQSGEEADADVPNMDRPFEVQAIFSSDIRLTFIPTEVGNEELVGTSEILGSCLANVGKMDALLFGSEINRSNEDLPLNQWRLRHAPMPRVLAEGGSGGDGGRMVGTSSPLVGNPAPDFSLDRLDGTRFNLAEQKGKVVVLDFWATWCGPCLQAMPVIDAAIEPFNDEEVLLVAVNLQESKDKIDATLERLGLSPMVVLDIDGVAAQRYEANAIPQTVVINREGVVTHVFVGGGGALGISLTEAVEGSLK